MPAKNIKTEKEKRLEQVAAELDGFGEKITDKESYEKYKLLASEEISLQKDLLIENMMASTQYNKALKKGEMPIVAMPEIKFQNRSIRVEMQLPFLTRKSETTIKPTNVN